MTEYLEKGWEGKPVGYNPVLDPNSAWFFANTGYHESIFETSIGPRDMVIDNTRNDRK